MSRAVPLVTQATFDHAAHASHRIRDLLPLYEGQLGGHLLYGGVNDRVGYRGIVLGYTGGGKIELLEPLAGSTFFDSFFARQPAGGLHHLTFRVDDLRLTVRRAREDGFEIVGVNEDDPNWREAFVHPRAGHGVLVQFVQSDQGHPTVDPTATIEGLLAC
jgi:methylmalonyl-CoA/ethylmalonyl-CoA epimerase